MVNVSLDTIGQAFDAAAGNHPVDHQRLSAGAGPGAAAERLADRPGRRAPHLPWLLRRLRGLLDAVRPCPVDDAADCLPRAARRRRRTAGADDADDDGAPCRPPHGPRHRCRRHAGHDRPDAGTVSGRPDPDLPGLALDILRQRPGWAGGDRIRLDGAAARRGHHRPAARPAGLRDDLAGTGAAAARPGVARARQPGGAVQPGRQRCACWRRSPGMRCAIRPPR